MTHPTIKELIGIALKQDADAIEFFFTLRDVLHFWDDLVDGDKPITNGQINAAMFKALVGLPQNKFYLRHQQPLSAVLTMAVANWHAATTFEHGLDERQLQLAYVIRSDYANILIQSAFLVGGYDWMMQMAPCIRDVWTAENYSAYRSNLQRERASRANSPDALVRQWYEEETAEYLDHGLSVFNAAMLGDTEQSHVDALLALIQPPPGAVVIDMGCGVGGVSRLMKHRDPRALFFGVTNVQAQVDAMHQLGGVEPVLSDFHHTPIDDALADVVMFNESIGYGCLPDVLGEAWRLLKPGGCVAIKDGVSLLGRDKYSDVWLWTTFAKGRIDGCAKAIGFDIEASHELAYDIGRYQQFVQNSPVMRDRYGAANIQMEKEVQVAWFWLLRKPGV